MPSRPLWLTILFLGFATAPHAVSQVQQLPPGTSLPADGTPGKPAAPGSAVLQDVEQRMAKQDWVGATTILQSLLQREPANAQALYDLAFCADALNDIPAAASAYRKAIAADPQNPMPAVGLGLLLARSGDSSGAITTLSVAVSLTGEGSAAVVATRAQAYRALARLRLAAAPEQSRDDLLQALRLSPETADDIQMGGEIAEALHDDAAAETAYARVANASPTDTAAAVQYARVLLREGKSAPAGSALDTALAAHPEDSQLLGEKAGVLLAQKNIAEAVPILERLHAQQPTNPAIGRLLARAYVAQGEPMRGDTLFRQLTEADPTDGELLVEWADSLMRQKRPAEAQPLLEHALTAHFETPEAKARAAAELAFAASANDHPEVVLRAIAIRTTMEPLDASSAFLLASAHDTLHQSREAAGAYRQFLELANGKFPDQEAEAKKRLQALGRAK